MKKLVIKTSLITLACIVGAMLIAFSATALFAPVKMAGFFDGVGNYSASVFFYEKQYKKTSDVSDLELLVSKMDRQDAYEKGYLKELVEHKDFYTLASEEGALISTPEHYYGEYALALKDNDKFEECIAISKSFISKYGYTEYNPLRVVISMVISEMPPNAPSQIDALISAVQSVEDGKTGQELTRIQNDLQQLNNAKN